MANKTIGDLTNKPTPAATDLIELEVPGSPATSAKTTLSGVKNLVKLPRVQTVSTNSALTLDLTSYDILDVTALAQDATINTPSGTPYDFQEIVYRLKDNGGARTLAWSSSFAGADLPKTTQAGSKITVKLIYDADSEKWNCAWTSPTAANLIQTTDLLTLNGRFWTIQKGWESSITPAESSMSLTTDGLTNVSSGAILKSQNNGVGRRSYITNTARSGGKALKFVLTPFGGAETTKTALQVWNSGFGLLTGDVNHAVQDGDEVWCRVWLYLSSNWSWAPETGSSLKTIRIQPHADWWGELIVGVDPGNSGPAYTNRINATIQNYVGGSMGIYGGPSGDCSGDPGAAADYPIGSWFQLEAYYKISADPATARIIIWRDGIKILERTGNQSPYTGRQTFNRAGTLSQPGPGVMFFSTWDVDAQQSGPTLPNGQQYILYDDIVCTNDRAWVQSHGSQDAHGNWRIGLV